MSTFAILATGPSLTSEIVESVRNLRRIAVSNAYSLAPDAEAMAANDRAWWMTHPEALTFKGDRYCHADAKGTIRPQQHVHIVSASNSGLVALHVAICRGATRVLLFGFDMHSRNGMHYFGPHLKNPNPTPARFLIFMKQFLEYSKRMKSGVEVFNCTPGSALKVFPFSTIDEALGEQSYAA